MSYFSEKDVSRFDKRVLVNPFTLCNRRIVFYRVLCFLQKFTLLLSLLMAVNHMHGRQNTDNGRGGMILYIILCLPACGKL